MNGFKTREVKMPLAKPPQEQENQFKSLNVAESLMKQSADRTETDDEAMPLVVHYDNNAHKIANTA